MTDIDTKRLRKLAGEYRATMDREVLHSWAKDVVEALPSLLSTIETLEARVEELTDERDEALRGPWPEWAEKIHQQLASYGYEPVDGLVDLPADLACWLEEFDPADHKRAVQAERQRDEAQAALKAAQQHFEQIGIIASGAATSHGDPSGALQMIDGYASDGFQALAQIDATGADADNTPHAFTWAASDTCQKCGNGKDHPVHGADALPVQEAHALAMADVLEHSVITFGGVEQTTLGKKAAALIRATKDAPTDAVDVLAIIKEHKDCWHRLADNSPSRPVASLYLERVVAAKLILQAITAMQVQPVADDGDNA